MGPIGNNEGQGLLLHSTLGVVSGATPQILSVAHQQVVLRRPVDSEKDSVDARETAFSLVGAQPDMV